jgi:hypothetical protein
MSENQKSPVPAIFTLLALAGSAYLRHRVNQSKEAATTVPAPSPAALAENRSMASVPPNMLLGMAMAHMQNMTRIATRR